MITQAELKDFVTYDDLTGIFTRKKWTGGKCNLGSKIGTKSHGYIKFSVKNKLHYAHRLAWLYVYGELPCKEIDHINGNRSDNKISNLRLVERFENLQNIRTRKNNTSGKIGVNWNRRCQKWEARITVNGKVMNLGMTTNFDDAVELRKKGEQTHHFFAPC